MKSTMNILIIRMAKPGRHGRKSGAVAALLGVAVATIGLWGGIIAAKAAERACYAKLWQSHPHNSPGRLEVVHCTNNCSQVADAKCSDIKYDPDGLVETQCDKGSSETGVDCVYDWAIIKKNGKLGKAWCGLDETGHCWGLCYDLEDIVPGQIKIHDDSTTYDNCRTPPSS